MIVLQGNLDKEVTVAFSGGVDSTAIVDFLKRKHIVTLLFINHGTKTSDEAELFVKGYADANDLNLNIYDIDTEVPAKVSQEEHWRNERYAIFHRLGTKVITGHHLDDCVETWIWSSMHGKGSIIPYNNKNVIRPFRLNRKHEFTNWCKRNEVSWVEDTSNADTSFIRNHIRHKMMPDVLVVNPGIHKVVRKKVLQDQNLTC